MKRLLAASGLQRHVLTCTEIVLGLLAFTVEFSHQCKDS